MSPEDFRKELAAQIGRAQRQGRQHIEVNAGELHRAVGGYPSGAGASHRMPLCCSVMRDELEKGNAEIVFQAESGQGSSFTVRYLLPRAAPG
jgi:5-methylcytosine-specific restriction protein A